MHDVDEEFWSIVERNGGHRPPEPGEITYRVRLAWDDVLVALVIFVLLGGLIVAAIKQSSGA